MIQEKQYIARIAQKYSLELILLFGSQATGRTHGQSDFDVAYLSKQKLDLEEEAKFKRLEASMKSNDVS
jgi:predicted nucleotidyltransferase